MQRREDDRDLSTVPERAPDDSQVGEPVDEHGTTESPEPDTVAGGYGERKIDHRGPGGGEAAAERHRRRAAIVGEPPGPDEPEPPPLAGE